MLKEISTKTKNLSTYGYFLVLLAINLVLMTIAGFFYNGDFHFWAYPFSYLDTVYTQEGFINLTALRIYGIDMAASTLILFLLANHLRKENGHNNSLGAMPCLVCGSGALITAVSPDDTIHTFHVLGSTLIVPTLWIMATAYLYDMRKEIGQTKYYILQFAFLQIPIFVCTITFFLGLDPINSILQKPALLGLSAALLYTTHHIGRAKTTS